MIISITFKEIKQGDELLTFLPKKKKNRNKSNN